MLQVFNTFVSKLQDVRQDMFRMPEAARRNDGAWYVGMAINPVEFSQQLSRLQISLRSEASSIAAVTPQNPPVSRIPERS